MKSSLREMNTLRRSLGLLLLALPLIAFVACEPARRDVSQNPLYLRTLSFRVIDIADDGTINVAWIEKRKVFGEPQDDKPDVSQVELLGIWSDRSREPQASFQQRVQFLRTLLTNQVVTAHTHKLYPITSVGGGDAGRLARMMRPGHEEIDRDLRLQDGRDVSEILLENGYTFFNVADFDNSRGLFALSREDRLRYENAEKRARAGALGIWASPESAPIYSEIERREALRRSGGIYYVFAQILLALVIAVLMLTTLDDPISYPAARNLLLLPAMLLLPELVRWFWTGSTGATAKVSDVKYLGGFTRVTCVALLAVTIFVVIKQMGILLAHGPLKQWREFWSISGARRVLFSYFVGLWLISIGFGLIYYFAGCASIKMSFGKAFADVLGLKHPSVGPMGAFCHLISQIQMIVVLLIWTPLCLFLIPKLPDKGFTYPLRTLVITTIGSVLVLLLVVASVFANIYSFNIELYGLSEPLDRVQCFFFALAPVVRQTFKNVYATSKWLLVAQVLELHIVIFLQAVAFRSLATILGKAIKTRLAWLEG